MLKQISICMLTKNAEKTLRATLESASGRFGQILLLDNGSSDKTLEMINCFPDVEVQKVPFIGFGPLRNSAAKMARNDWILALDSDEILSLPLLEELSLLRLDKSCAYEIPRHNFYNGRQIKGCGWHPESVVRLYHRESASYSNSFVHESVQTQNARIVRLKNPLLHTPYRTTADFLSKMQHYTTLFAEQNVGKKNSSVGKAIFHAFFAFIKSYLIGRGIFDGAEGFVISLYNANTAFYKYLKLFEANRSGTAQQTIQPPQDRG